MVSYKISDKHFFVNPYNFVPVDLHYTKREKIANDNLLTGYMRCRMIGKTYLAIPDVSNRKSITLEKQVNSKTVTETHYKYPFMGINYEESHVPRIPGSSIRGVVRNVFETLTNSCFGSMQDDTVITARSKKAFKPGLLVKEQNIWKLYNATPHLIAVDAQVYEKRHMEARGIALFKEKDLSYRSGDSVYFEVTRNSKGNGQGINRTYVTGIYEQQTNKSRQGYLCIGEKSANRHFQKIFEKGAPESKYKIVTEDDLKKLESILSDYRNASINKKYPDEHKGYLEYEKMKQNGVVPVYYQIQGQNLYMSFAALGRKAFANTLNDLVYEKAPEKCNSRNNLCLACAVFGTIRGEGIGSRVRFTDAFCTNYSNELLEKDVVFDELSSPRMSYAPFYLRNITGYADYRDGYDSTAFEIRGRKYYWHYMPTLKLEKTLERTNRNATFDVLAPTAEFEFKIYFDGITREQLNLLAAAVHLNENDAEGKLCHKIGHGKPLGYGSVKIVVEECKLRTFNLENGWHEEKEEIPCDESWQQYEADETLEALKVVCSLDTIEKEEKYTVSYPDIIAEQLSDSEKKKLEENDLASHRWFTENCGLGATKAKQVLPEIKQAIPQKQGDLRLAYYEIVTETEKKTYSNTKTWKAIILSEGKVGKNEKFLEYSIQILNDEMYQGKFCKVSAPSWKTLQVNQEVEVELFRDTIFNLKRGR